LADLIDCCLVSITLNGFNAPVPDEAACYEQTDELI